MDNKLSLKSWCLNIRENILSRINFIRRLTICGKLGRSRMEKLYNGYVRGFMNYGALVWSQGPKKEVEMIYAADRKGLRVCTGALLRTSTASLLEESNIESFFVTLNRMGLLYCIKMLSYPELSLVKELANTNGTKSCASMVLQIWLDANLPTENLNITVMRTLVLNSLAPKKKSNPLKYWSSWKVERLIARIRMGVLPCKSWAKSMKLDFSDLCRHCTAHVETLDHLFGNCEALDYTKFNLHN